MMLSIADKKYNIISSIIKSSYFLKILTNRLDYFF